MLPVAVMEQWMRDLERRHLADLRFQEVSRALRAVSSAYVERRHTALAGGRVLDGAGKRAAFALYYGPMHALAASAVLASLEPDGAQPSAAVVDLGCGTGAVGAAVGTWCGARHVTGIDTHPWALDEARHTYATFGLDATLRRGSAARLRLPAPPALVVAAYVANELTADERERLREALVAAVRRGAGLLLLEPLAQAAAPWWPAWVETFAPLGARADAWKLRVSPPDLVRRLGEAAGLNPTAINVRALYCRGRGGLPGPALPIK